MVRTSLTIGLSLKLQQFLLDAGCVRQSGDIVPGEETLKIVKALHVFDNQRGVLRGAGEDLFQALFPGADDVQQEVAPLSGNPFHHMLDVLPAIGFPVTHRKGDVVQARPVVTHERLGRRRQLLEMIDEIGRVAGGKHLGGTAYLVGMVRALGYIGRRILVRNVVRAPVVVTRKRKPRAFWHSTVSCRSVTRSISPM